MIKKITILITLILCFCFSITSVSATANIIKTETDNKVIFTEDDNGKFKYSWAFNKSEYKNDYNFDLGINFVSPNEKEINDLISKDMEKEYVSFVHHGSLPGVATIKIPTTKFKDGEKLNLYYYNEKTNKIETIKSNVIVANGYVTFDINHCSDYFLTLSIVTEATGNNNNGMIIIGMIIVIVVLIGYTMFNKKK